MRVTNTTEGDPTGSPNAPEVKGPAVARLLVGDGGVLVLRPGRYVIGRGCECDLVIANKGVSRRHAVLEVREAEAVITDLGSRNGVLVNDRPTGRSLLVHESVVRLGGATWVFEWLDRVLTDDEPTPSFEDPGGDLSPAQRRVLTHLLSGLAEKEIAVRLDVSQHTVHNHVKRIYAALRVNSRPELLARFVSSPFRDHPDRAE